MTSFLKNFFFIVIILLLNYSLIAIAKLFGILGMLIAFTTMFIMFTIYARSINIEKRTLFTLFLLIVYVIIYYILRLSVSAMQEPIKLLFHLGDKEYSQFTSIFSLFYGASQLIGGYLIGRGGTKTIGFFLFCIGLSSIFMSLQTSFTGLLISRALLGFFSSVSAIGLTFYLGIYLPMFLSLPIYKLAGAFGFIFAGSVIQTISDTKLPFQLFFQYLGIVSIIFGILIFMFTNNLTIMKTESENKSNDQNFKFTDIFQDKLIILLFIYSFLSVYIMYIYQDGWLTQIQMQLFPSETNTKLLTSTFLNWSAITACITPVLVNMFGLLRFILYSIVLQLFGFILFIFPNIFLNNTYGVLIAKFSVISIAIGGLTHNLPQILVTYKYSGKKLGTYLGFLNCGAMLLGCSLSQFSVGYIGSKLYPDTLTFSADQLINLLRIFSFAPILSVIIAWILYKYYDK